MSIAEPPDATADAAAVAEIAAPHIAGSVVARVAVVAVHRPEPHSREVAATRIYCVVAIHFEAEVDGSDHTAWGPWCAKGFQVRAPYSFRFNIWAMKLVALSEVLSMLTLSAVSGSSQREQPAAQSDISCLKVSWIREAIKLGARRPNSRSKVCTSRPYMHRYKAQESQCQPWIRASFHSGWATAVPHVVGERHHGRRFAELPPSF